MTTPDAFTERLFISVATKGQSSYNEYRSTIGSVTIDRGTREYDSEAILNGGRIPSFTPEEDTEISGTMYPVTIGTGSSFAQLFNGTSDSSQPLSSSPTLDRSKIKAVICWSDGTSRSTAVASGSSGDSELRFQAENGYVTEFTPEEFSPDGNLSYSFTFKFPAFDKDANANITVESADDSTALGSISNYS